MTKVKSLEDDMMLVLASSFKPVTLQEMWDELSDAGISVPITYLAKVLAIIEKSGDIRQKAEPGRVVTYEIVSFWRRLSLLSHCNLLRSLVKAHRMPKMQKHNFLIFALACGLLAGPCAYAEPDFSVTELGDEPTAVTQADLTQAPATDGSSSATVNATVEPPVIVTTRPSFTDSWLAIPQGSLQVESGVTYSDNGNETRSWVLPESMIKLGVGKNTEFRFTVPNYTYLRDDDAGKLANNFGDMTIGLSHHIALPWKLDLALIPFLNVPTGANNVSSNSLDPQMRVVLAKTVTPKLVIASQMDARWYTGKDASARVVMNPTLIGYYNFTPKLAMFLEYGGFIPTEGDDAHYAQGGFLYLPTPRQQWDIRLATGLNKAASDIVVGFGYSFRVDGLFGASKEFSSFKRAGN